MTTPEKSQARIRYERSHPHWSTRLPTDISKDVDQILLETGMNKVGFIRWAVHAYKREHLDNPGSQSGLAEQLKSFLQLYEEGDPEILRFIATIEGLASSEPFQKLLLRL